MKQMKLATVALVGVTFGISVISSAVMKGETVSAKVRAAKVLSYSELQKTKYNVNGGYMFKNAHLTNRLHHMDHYLGTTFYATKSATIRKSNGKNAVYYYLRNGNGKIRGWVWKGNLTKIKSYTTQKADIRAMMKIVRTMSPDAQNDILTEFKDMTPKAAYDGNSSISSVISDIAYHVNWYSITIPTFDDYQAVGKVYTLFQGRFNSLTNDKLSTLYASYSNALKSDDESSMQEASYNLADMLANAVKKL